MVMGSPVLALFRETWKHGCPVPAPPQGGLCQVRLLGGRRWLGQVCSYFPVVSW